MHDSMLYSALRILPPDLQVSAAEEMRAWLLAAAVVCGDQDDGTSQIAEAAEFEAFVRCHDDDRSWRLWSAIAESLRLSETVERMCDN